MISRRTVLCGLTPTLVTSFVAEAIPQSLRAAVGLRLPETLRNRNRRVAGPDLTRDL